MTAVSWEAQEVCLRTDHIRDSRRHTLRSDFGQLAVSQIFASEISVSLPARRRTGRVPDRGAHAPWHERRGDG